MVIINSGTSQKPLHKGQKAGMTKIQSADQAAVKRHAKILSSANIALKASGQKALRDSQAITSARMMDIHDAACVENPALLRIPVAAGTRIQSATNTTNIAVAPKFKELIPLGVANSILDQIASFQEMDSRESLHPFFKVVTETGRGATPAKKILHTPYGSQSGSDPTWASSFVTKELARTPDESGDVVYLGIEGRGAIIPGHVELQVRNEANGTTIAVKDDAAGNLYPNGNPNATEWGQIDYERGVITMTDGSDGLTIYANYRFDNENVGAHEDGTYGANIVKAYLQLDRILLRAEAYAIEAHSSYLANYAAKMEYGAELSDVEKTQMMGEIMAEINSRAVLQAWRDASAMKGLTWNSSGKFNSVDGGGEFSYFNNFKTVLDKGSLAVRQVTRQWGTNRICCGTNVLGVFQNMAKFQEETISEDISGACYAGSLGAYKVYVDPNLGANDFVQLFKGNDKLKASMMVGCFLPIAATQRLERANMDVEQGYVGAYAINTVNPMTMVKGSIAGSY